MNFKFTLEQLEEQSKNRPQGYKDEILQIAAKINEKYYELTQEQYEYLADKYRLPSKIEMIKNLVQAAKDAAIKGLKSRSAEEVEKNLKICTNCPFLIEKGFRCGQCGCCLKYKVLLDNAWHCPQNKW